MASDTRKSGELFLNVTLEVETVLPEAPYFIVFLPELNTWSYGVVVDGCYADSVMPCAEFLGSEG